jgi:hypothetical protein
MASDNEYDNIPIILRGICLKLHICAENAPVVSFERARSYTTDVSGQMSHKIEGQIG